MNVSISIPISTPRDRRMDLGLLSEGDRVKAEIMLLPPILRVEIARFLARHYCADCGIEKPCSCQDARPA
jgi:hypothetical protein